MRSNRTAMPESKLRARRRRRARFMFAGGGVLLAALIVGFCWLSWKPFWRIATIDISGTETVDAQMLEAAAREGISGTRVLVFPSDNILWYPKRALSARLAAAYPIFKTVDVHAETPTSIMVRVEERMPAALWCASRTASSSPCMLMDESGIAYALAPEFSGSPYVRYYKAVSEEDNMLPVSFLPAEQFRSLSALVEAMAKSAGTEAALVDIDAYTDVTLVFENGFTAKFTLAEDAAAVVSRFKAALGSGAFVGEPLSSFEYLDLRFGSRLYYKKK